MEVKNFNEKSVMVVGATGKLGRKIVEMILKSTSHRCAIMNKDEKSLISLKSQFQDDRLRFFLGNSRDESRLLRAFEGVDIIIYCDCFSNRELLIYNPMEAVRNNVYAYENLVTAAIERSVSQVLVLLQGDFFSENEIYDATKACAEKIVIQGNGLSSFKRTKFSVLRMADLFDFPDQELQIQIEKNDLQASTQYFEKNKFKYRLGCSTNDIVKFVSSSIDKMTGGEIFIPKLQSYNVCDYLQEIFKKANPQCEIGELEMPIAFDSEIKNIYNSNDFFVITPNAAWWDEKNFRYKFKDAEKYSHKKILSANFFNRALNFKD